MIDLTLAKKVAKEHGVKGFRKLKLKRTIYVAGKQCQFLNTYIALRLISRMEELGFTIGDKQTTIELAEKGLLDTIILEG